MHCPSLSVNKSYYYIKIASEFRNVGDGAVSRDAYAMSHLSPEACTQRLVAGRGDRYRLAAASSVACSYTTAEHWTTGLAAKPLVVRIIRYCHGRRDVSGSPTVYPRPSVRAKNTVSCGLLNFR